MIAALHRTPPAMIFMMLAVGLAACWSAGTPIGILAPLGALFLYARGYWLISLWSGLLITLAGTVLAAMLYPGAIRDAALPLAALMALAGCVGKRPGSRTGWQATRTACPKARSTPMIGPRSRMLRPTRSGRACRR